MNTWKNIPDSRRELVIDFSLFGEEPDTKLELIELLIENLGELQKAASSLGDRNNVDFFAKVCHKVKTAIHLLQDFEFRMALDDLKAGNIASGNILRFEKLSCELVTSLKGLKKEMENRAR